MSTTRYLVLHIISFLFSSSLRVIWSYNLGNTPITPSTRNLGLIIHTKDCEYYCGEFLSTTTVNDLPRTIWGKKKNTGWFSLTHATSRPLDSQRLVGLSYREFNAVPGDDLAPKIIATLLHSATYNHLSLTPFLSVSAFKHV